MKKVSKITLLLIFALFLTNTSQAQTFTLSGEIRPRAEVLNGYKSLRPTDDAADKAGAFISQRSRLNLAFSDTKYKVGIVFQDVRTWGGTSQLNTSDGYLALHEAWAEYLFSEKASLKVGRQEVNLDDQRIFGAVGWAQQARSHDMALFNYKGGINLKIGAALNTASPSNQAVLYTLNNYKSLQFIWLNKKTDKVDISALLLNNGLHVQSGTDLKIVYGQTLGLRGAIKLDKLSLSAAGYLQTGKDKAERDISAYDFMADAAYKVSDGFSLKIGAEILSGTDQNSTKGENNSFAPLYGTNHKFNGFMDYFYVGNHGNNVGLNDLYFGLNFKKGRTGFGATFHNFSSNGVLMDGNSEADKALGSELDLAFSHKLNKQLALSAVYCQMFAGKSMELIKDGDSSKSPSYFYVMMSFKPVFLNWTKPKTTE